MGKTDGAYHMALGCESPVKEDLHIDGDRWISGVRGLGRGALTEDHIHSVHSLWVAEIFGA
jgi:hypothetical protein